MRITTGITIKISCKIKLDYLYTTSFRFVIISIVYLNKYLNLFSVPAFKNII